MRSTRRPFLFFCFSFFQIIHSSFDLSEKLLKRGKVGEEKCMLSQVHDDYITYELRNLRIFFFFPLRKKKKNRADFKQQTCSS
ncbi:hypothetical protein B9Z19DRAFT_1082092 [Tuber borchii]|uniref:Secreted protein n=1 Tax=Tuber borchii TaxID=42251 RepID=A0A2T6ZUX0_TUBBO|nr:hypothetical protein B9Z19DRAFT_1082092 [Tuber borchii]